LELDLGDTLFNLDATLNCGQVFRWSRDRRRWVGVVQGSVIAVQQDDRRLLVRAHPAKDDAFIRNYFRLDDDLRRITSELNRDPVIGRAVEALRGLRLVRQDPWECLISFICATFASIPRVRRMVGNLSTRFGATIEGEGGTFHAFPSCETLSEATMRDLIDCGVGYRARYIRETARRVAACDHALGALSRLSYEVAGRALQRFMGVGLKAADCILLFSMEKLEAFPIDVWIARILFQRYRALLPVPSLRHRGVTSTQYRKLGAFARSYFGDYAGYAQEYLYHYYRTQGTRLRRSGPSSGSPIGAAPSSTGAV
jgi:N-glycosylase/DNA lyase